RRVSRPPSRRPIPRARAPDRGAGRRSSARGRERGRVTSERPTLLVVHVEPALEAPGPSAVHRTYQPCRALGELENVTVVSGSLLWPALTESGLLDEADVLVLGEAGEADLLPIVDARRRQQRLTVYEIESHLLSPPPGARTADRARDMVRRSMPLHLARQA